VTVETISPEPCIEKTVDRNGDVIFKDDYIGHADDNAAWKVVVTNCGDRDLTNDIITDSNGHDFSAAFNLTNGESKEFSHQTKVDVDTTSAAHVNAIDLLSGTVSGSDSASNLVTCKVRLRICKYEDKNGNGQRDSGGSRLSSWVFSVTELSPPLDDSTNTDVYTYIPQPHARGVTVLS
jgi:hypothetical protein